MGHPGIAELGIRVHRTRDKPAEEGGGRRPVKAVIVIEDSYPAFREEENLPACLNGRRNATLWFMRTIPNWDQYYLDICKVVAARSKDPNTQIGCVIVGRTTRSAPPATIPSRAAFATTCRSAWSGPLNTCGSSTRNATRICNAARAGTATEGLHDLRGDHAVHGLRAGDRAGGHRGSGGLRGAHAAVFQRLLQRALRDD